MGESYRPYYLEVRGALSISEFSVGSGSELSLTTDAPVLRDVEDNPYLPASSLRGVIRAHLEREAPLWVSDAEVVIGSLFGETPSVGHERTSRASRVRLYDSNLETPISNSTEIRDHVKIDGRLGSAEKKAKFDQEIAHGGILKFRMVYEGDSQRDPEVVLLGEAVRALREGEMSCGGKGSLGHGRMQLSEIQYASFDRTDPGQLAAWLNSRMTLETVWATEFAWPERSKVDWIAGLQRSKFTPVSRLDLSLTIHFDGPVLLRAPIPPVVQKGQAFDARKPADHTAKGLMTADHAFIQTGADGRYCLPGASLRGVLRHQAARIATTLGLKEAVGELFGEVQGKSARRGLIEIGSGTLVGKPRPVYLDHVAIDRITGFAADKKKFATCGLQSPSFETFVRLRFREQHLHLVALAGFVLRDLFDGMLWCGGGTSRGYGFITGVSVRKTVLDLTPPLRQASGDSNPTAEEAPDDFLAEVHRAVTPGRTRWEIAGDTIPFDSWFWQRAEAAWTDALAQAAGGAR